jgi:hypothetical protein
MAVGQGDTETGGQTMTSQEIKVDTRQFRRKHGHEPRGRFLWTFRIGTKEKLWTDGYGPPLPLYLSKRGEYEECLAAAIRSAEKHGATSISVSSTVYGQDEGC